MADDRTTTEVLEFHAPDGSRFHVPLAVLEAGRLPEAQAQAARSLFDGDAGDAGADGEVRVAWLDADALDRYRVAAPRAVEPAPDAPGTDDVRGYLETVEYYGIPMFKDPQAFVKDGYVIHWSPVLGETGLWRGRTIQIYGTREPGSMRSSPTRSSG